ncbi:Uncharacterized phage protein gp47/JayE [Paenibacillus algorifonticola]|uniref:Uncharacterized phage protein gp47/JayE n=1 Tax=Paenibacillus algorifonticola TaxID=684063 RepID=A0A1I2AHA0_9BACL|nr:baseplate J/gp47 family protein [Paenibacillus algorifonticola]SFE43252.1 Uncharacterized phage protein gp47/JayE [Paenibacillus algorifonticola]
MTYSAPTVTASGLTTPTYEDIRNKLIADAESIFGPEVYLEPDSADYQWISSVASMVFDSFLCVQSAYNSRGPATAIGTGLDIIVGINGISRRPGVASSAIVTVTGTAGTAINSGIVEDNNGNRWSLTNPTIIGQAGSATSLATCLTAGDVVAFAGEINKIITPTLGWTSVTNPADATIGSFPESDAELRARQAISTAQPSRTVIEGLDGGIAALAAVTRFIVYENDTNVVDSDGLPPHSITCVVEGGTDQDIADVIFSRKTPGAYTNGAVAVTVTDQYGVQSTIRFDRPTDVDIVSVINVKQLNGYTTDTTDQIKASVAEFCSSLDIGNDLHISSIWGAALSVNAIPANPTFAVTSVTAAKSGDIQGTTDIPISYSQVAKGDPANVTVNVS